jgi:hypothetical protein
MVMLEVGAVILDNGVLHGVAWAHGVARLAALHFVLLDHKKSVHHLDACQKLATVLARNQ